MSTIKTALSFLRWRVIAVRYITMITKINGDFFKKPKESVLKQSKDIIDNGYYVGDRLESDKLDQIIKVYQPRIENAVKSEKGHTFVNLVNETDISTENPIMKLAFSKDVLDLAIDYFGGKLSLYSIQVLYSFEHSGALRSSQLWHKDFGDSKTLHSIYYLNDIKNDDGGPFVFTNKKDSKNINWAPYIRRIEDEAFKTELGDGEIIRVYGTKGHNFHVDPAACYHCGSRCKTPRLAAFISFNTSSAFVGSVAFIKNNREKLINVACKLRPDLERTFFEKLIK